MGGNSEYLISYLAPTSRYARRAQPASTRVVGTTTRCARCRGPANQARLAYDNPTPVPHAVTRNAPHQPDWTLRTEPHHRAHSTVMAQPLPLPAHTDPAHVAEAQRRLFTGQRLHVGNSPVVHELDWAPWLDELVLPGPACGQGYAGTGARGELRPTRHPVTCRRCLRLHEPDDEQHQEQPALFALPTPDDP